jgi:hypothetical protein
MEEAADKQPDISVATGSAGFLARLVEMTSNAQMQINILSQTLDRRLYGNEDFLATLQSFLLSHERARLRVIVRTSGPAARSGHRLIELGRRLSSRIEFRDLSAERRLIEREIVIADERSLLVRETPEALDARYYAHAPLLAREELRSFETLWQESLPSEEFRSFRI